MLDRQSVLSLFEASADAFIWNLDFIPDDRLGWKPAPDAKSAMEIVNHLAPFLDSISARLGEKSSPAAPATNREEAKRMMGEAASRYISAVRGASSEALDEKFRDDLPLTLGWMVTASTIDTIHHAGQIAYIETLLGDNELHFDSSALPDWAVG